MGGVVYLHHVPVGRQGLVYNANDPEFYFRIHCVSQDGLQVRGFRAALREDETLVLWIQLSKESVLRVKVVEVPLFDRGEGLLFGVCERKKECVQILSIS